VIKSDLGTGKTHQTRQHLKKTAPLSALILTPRVIFGQCLVEQLREDNPKWAIYTEGPTAVMPPTMLPTAVSTTLPTALPTMPPAAAPTYNSTALTYFPTATPTAAPTFLRCDLGTDGCDTVTTFCEGAPGTATGFVCHCRPGFSPILNVDNVCEALASSSTAAPVPTAAGGSSGGSSSSIGVTVGVVVLVVVLCGVGAGYFSFRKWEKKNGRWKRLNTTTNDAFDAAGGDDEALRDDSLDVVDVRKRSQGRERLSRSSSIGSKAAFPEGELTYNRVIGEGAFSRVWSGTWGYERVAIKVLKSSTEDGGPDAIRDFEREVNTLQSIRHPCLIRFFGAGLKSSGHAFFVTELAMGGSLRSVLANVLDSLPWATRRWRMATQIAEGMSHLHALGIIHRDLKSDNCLVDAEQNVKVADFGESKDIDAAAMSGSVSSGPGSLTKAVGTPLWMAPECFAGMTNYTSSVDVYVALFALPSHFLALSSAAVVYAMACALRAADDDASLCHAYEQMQLVRFMEHIRMPEICSCFALSCLLDWR
jgi:hypothetical protein